jgi:hypothetical protein
MARNSTSLLALLALLAGLGALPAPAATWQVAQDGSGDFVTIQEAIEAAATGDVIELAAGAYSDPVTFESGGAEILCYALIEGKDLTIVGAGTDVTFIGPPTMSPPYQWEYGIFLRSGAGVALRDLTIGNVSESPVYAFIPATFFEATDCVFRDSHGSGIVGDFPDGLTVRSCLFTGLTEAGISVNSPTQALVEDCEFVDNGGFGCNFSFNGCVGIVRNCVFQGGDGVQFGGAAGLVENCQIYDFRTVGVYANYSGDVEIIGNHIRSESEIAAGIWATNIGLLTARHNTVMCAGSCVYLFSDRDLDFHENHLLRIAPEAFYIRVGEYFPYWVAHLDFTLNWWGTTDADEIAEWIWDGHDDSSGNLLIYIDYIPFLGGPVRVEQHSLSAVKELFR